MTMEASVCQSRSPGADIASLFPHDVLRKGQDQFLENARECIDNRIHLLAHAPTGLGKTAVSLSAALETTLNEDGFVLFLTSRQSQHDIAIETLKRIWKKRRIGVVDLIGREDMCLSRRKSGRVPCIESEDCYFLHGKAKEASERMLQKPMHVRESIHMCLKAGCCPHVAVMAALRTADIAICDYNQVFGHAESSLTERTDRRESETVLIIDEGHNLPGRIMENNTGILTEARIRSAMQSPALQSFSDDLRVLVEAIGSLSSGPNDEVHLTIRDLDDRLRSACGIDSKGLAAEMTSSLGNKDYFRSMDLIESLELWSKFGDATVRFVEKKARRIVSKLVDPS
ncbi:MAG: DEAD/DEAH box helicase family protein, partial [Methanomassiliicoccales archaeon]|nr:DEAD/DEAH box helicase family protein [Methanomassiliicoccales archaeon]